MSAAKALVQILAAIVAVLPVVIPAISDDMGVTEWINFAILAVGAYQVWNTNNSQFWPTGKAYASVAMSVLVAVNILVIDNLILDGGISSVEWVQLFVAVLTPIVVYITRNAYASPSPA